jgi:hypothetical protein
MPYLGDAVYMGFTALVFQRLDVPHLCSIPISSIKYFSCSTLSGLSWMTLNKCYPAFVSAYTNEQVTKKCGTSYNPFAASGPLYYPAPTQTNVLPSPPPLEPPSSAPVTPPQALHVPVSQPETIYEAPQGRAVAPVGIATPNEAPSSSQVNGAVDLKLVIGLTAGAAVLAGGAAAVFLIFRRRSRRHGERQPLLVNDSDDFSESSAPIGLVNFSRLRDEQFEDAVLLEKLGSGGSGAEVFRCDVGGFTCAVKVMDLSLFGDPSSKDEFVNEINLLVEASRRSDYVVKYLHHIESGQQCRLFMEYCPTTLAGQIEIVKRDSQRFKPNQIARICRPILMALSALHSREAPILHRDLKAANVFAAFDKFGSPVSIKLGDFGISKLLEHGMQARTVVGTPGYIPPEVLRGSSRGAEPYSTAADIYSFGMIMYELFALKAPYSEFKWDADRCDAILAGKLPEMPVLSEEYNECVKLFTRCVSHAPSERPSARKLLEDPLFKF